MSTSVPAGVDNLPYFSYSSLVPELFLPSGRGSQDNFTQKPASIFPDDNKAVWLSKKQVFRSTQSTFNNLLWNFKNYLFNGIFY